MDPDIKDPIPGSFFRILAQICLQPINGPAHGTTNLPCDAGGATIPVMPEGWVRHRPLWHGIPVYNYMAWDSGQIMFVQNVLSS